MGRWQWALLAALTIVLVVLFYKGGVGGAFFLAPLLAGVVCALSGSSIRIPQSSTLVSQAVIGCMVGSSLDAKMLGFMLASWPVVIFVVLSTGAAATAMAWVLARTGRFDAQTAAWGSMPGAASMVVSMAAELGGDARLVAFMQYVRVIIVVSTASLVAHLLTGAAHGGAPPPPAPLLAHLRSADVGFVQTAQTLIVAAIAFTAGRFLKIPAGPLIISATLAAILHLNHILDIKLPFWLLAIAYVAVGWYVGLQFDRQVLTLAFRSVPVMVMAIFVLIAICAAAGAGVSHFLNVDPLTGYLASSPGGLDSITILALDNKTNLSVIVTIQTLRFFAVLLAAPYLARSISRFI